MTKKTAAHTSHNRMREFPRRELLKITVAAFRAGLEDIQREWPAHGLWDETGKRWHWFDIAGIYQKKFFLFDFAPGQENHPETNAKEWERKAQKEAWAVKENIPLMIMEHGFTTQEMVILIKKFLMENTLQS